VTIVQPDTRTVPLLEVWRCSGCRRILAKLRVVPGCVLEVKCHCGTMNVLKVQGEKRGSS
jgi:phage FluMu protein Com